MRKLTFGMNLSLDGYIAAPGDDLGWSVPCDELFQWWSDRVGATGLALYARKLWETMSSYWPTADRQPDATPAEIEFARRWRDMPKVVFSSTISTGRLEHPPGHRRRGHRDHPAQGRGWRPH
jgi:dihydrofolate reductase